MYLKYFISIVGKATIWWSILLLASLFGACLAHGFPWEYETSDAWLVATGTSDWTAFYAIWLVGPIFGLVMWCFGAWIAASHEYLNQRERFFSSIRSLNKKSD